MNFGDSSRRIERGLMLIEAGLAAIASVILFAIMLIVATDVGMRYLLNRPFAWSYDLVSLYLVLALFYLCLSRGLATHVHVGVDILHYYVSQRTRRIFALIGCTVSAPLFAAITIACANRAWAAWTQDDVVAGAIAWPTWITVGLAPVGTGLLTLRLVVNGLAHLVAAAGGPEIVPLPPLARSDEGLDQAAFE